MLAVSPVMTTVGVADVKGQVVPLSILASYAATATLSVAVGQRQDAVVELGVTVTVPVITGTVVSAAAATVRVALVLVTVADNESVTTTLYVSPLFAVPPVTLVAGVM